MIFKGSKKGAKSSQSPAFWSDYVYAWNGNPPGNALLSELEWVILDTETTGLNPQRDRILSIGAVLVKHRTIYVEHGLELYIANKGAVSEESIAIHELLPNKDHGGASEGPVLEQLLGFIQSRPVVGHHIRFDQTILNAHLKRLGAGKLKNPVLDTATIAKRVSSAGASSLSLDNLCNQYRITPFDRHTACGDAFITALLWIKLLGKLEKRGICKWGQLRSSFWSLFH